MDDHHPYPVTLNIEMPEQYERAQLLVRLLILTALSMFHQSLLGVFGALYLILPCLAAVLVAQRGEHGYAANDATWIAKALAWVLAFYAYMTFVTDRFPLDADKREVRLQIATSGEPTPRGALLRLLTSLPHALLLAVLFVVSCLLSVIMGVWVLFTRRAPVSLRGFQRNLVSSLARLFAYHASLVDAYPPFASSDADLTPKTPTAA